MLKWEFILLLVVYIRHSSCLFDDLHNTGIEIFRLYSELNEIGPRSPYEIDELFSSSNRKSREINTQLDLIYHHLNGTEKNVNLGKFGLLLNNITIDNYLETIQLSMMNIDKSYEELYLYKNGCKSTSIGIFQKFIYSVIVEIEGEIANVRKNVIGKNAFLPRQQNLIHAISSYAAAQLTQMCNGPQIISTALFRLFRIVMIAELKANTILAFANMYRYSGGPGWRVMNSMAREMFKERSSVYVNTFAANLYIVDPVYLRACDPDDGVWKRNENFHELEGTFQATIYRYHWGICKYSSCNNIIFDTENRCETSVYDSRSPCSHTVDECAYLGGITACVLYLNSTKLGSFGRNFECPKTNSHLIEDGTGLNYVYAACACNCYSSQNKISLLLMESEVTLNKVIIGLRFIRKNRILYIQPKVGTLGGHGSILRFSERWMRIPNKIGSSHLHVIDRAYRVFFLDDLRLPPYYVLTGVKFNAVTRGTIEGFAIQIFGVPFDYESGTILHDSKFALSSRVSNSSIGEKVAFEAVSPIHITSRHIPSEGNMEYVSLERSKLDDDFGQSTLPLFDGVPITTLPSSALGGIGIFHKGVEGYAGFISLRIFAIEYKQIFMDFQLDYMANGELSLNYSKPN